MNEENALLRLLSFLVGRDEPPMAPKRPDNVPPPPAALPSDRPVLNADDDVTYMNVTDAGPDVLSIMSEETRPMDQQPVRYTTRPDGQPGLAFTIDPRTGEAVRWLPPGANTVPIMPEAEMRRLRQTPGAPPPGQLPPRSVAVPDPPPEPTPEEAARLEREARERNAALDRWLRARAAASATPPTNAR